MKYAVCFGDLVKVRGEWETAVRANERGVVILTPPRPTMDGSANPGFRLVGYDKIEGHISIAAVPGAIETLQQIAAGEIAVDVESCDEKKNILVLRPERNEFGYEVVQLARAALRAVRGEESA